jgi:hypothetical protein
MSEPCAEGDVVHDVEVSLARKVSNAFINGAAVKTSPASQWWRGKINPTLTTFRASRYANGPNPSILFAHGERGKTFTSLRSGSTSY